MTEGRDPKIVEREKQLFSGLMRTKTLPMVPDHTPADVPTAVKFGSLEDVSVREAWDHEAHSFTPWLADNLELLGGAVGLDLEFVGREVQVGRYSADILARTVADDEVVLIENQLEGSDHGHLGQIMTYLAGTEAKIIIWTAAGFREEHLSAIRWLNQNSNEGISFFAVRVRVVRIANSPMAPLFEVIEQPNDWDRSIREKVRNTEDLSALGEERQSFWDRYAEIYPAIAEDKSGGGNSSKWREVRGRPLIISRYKAKDHVGIFVRGARGINSEELAELVSPFVLELESALETPSGRTNSFQKIGPNAGDPTNWDAAIEWLEKETNAYEQAILDILPTEMQ